jgi:hypothetical protein
MKAGRTWLLITAVVGAGLLAATIWLTGQKDMTNRENGLLQFIFFAAGVALSFYFGRQSVVEAAQDVLRPHGRKAVRRIVNLAQGITSFATVIREQRSLLADQARASSGQVPFEQVEFTFNTLDIVVAGQLRTAADAIEDWRDIVPDEVRALEEGAGDEDV